MNYKTAPEYIPNRDYIDLEKEILEAFILAKDADSSDNWIIHDTTRNPSNPVGAYLRPNLSSAEGTFSHYDILSNGFKNLYAGGSLNGSGKNIIYMAFAESPFTNSNGVPNNAR